MLDLTQGFLLECGRRFYRGHTVNIMNVMDLLRCMLWIGCGAPGTATSALTKGYNCHIVSTENSGLDEGKFQLYLANVMITAPNEADLLNVNGT